MQSRNIRWAAAAMAAMLLISGVWSCNTAQSQYSFCLFEPHAVLQNIMWIASFYAMKMLQRLHMYFHAGVAAAMNLREAWISASSFVESYQYMIVKVHHVTQKHLTESANCPCLVIATWKVNA